MSDTFGVAFAKVYLHVMCISLYETGESVAKSDIEHYFILWLFSSTSILWRHHDVLYAVHVLSLEGWKVQSGVQAICKWVVLSVVPKTLKF